MTDATDHALEQAERIVQYAKYSDRFLVVEGYSAAERRAFVKLIDQKLPRQVRPVTLRADAGNGANTLIEQLSTLLQLPPGIEGIDELIRQATDTLGGQDRLLIVVEHADHWLASDGADTLFELINKAHDRARERLLFLMVGPTGLGERVETAQPLAGLVADLHCAQLLGTAPPPSAGAAAVGTTAPATPRPSPPDTTHAGDAAPTSPTPARRSAWASPTLLIAAVVSIAVVSIGAFALLGRSEAPTLDKTATAPAAGTEDATADERTVSADESTAGEAELSRIEPANAEPGSRDAEAEPVDHGEPPFVPLPVEEAAEASAETQTAMTDAQIPTEPKQTDTAETTAAEPVTEEARGVAAATPPATVDNAWYRDQPRARAAVQMAAFGKLDDANKMIERFAGDNHPRAEWRIYTQRIDGKILYTVTLGNYPSAERARHAIDELPAELKKLKPYPRSVGAIQDRLTEATP